MNLAPVLGFGFGSLWWVGEMGQLRRSVEFTSSNVSTRPARERRWVACGIVRAVALDINRIFIDHEDIPGLTVAMTMAFEVADPGLLNDVVLGDHVRFTLLEQDKQLILVDIEKEFSP